MKTLEWVTRLVDNINEKVGVFSGWLTGLLVLVVCYDVFTRYFLNQSSIAAQELEWHLFSAIFLFGAAYALKHDRHVRVDVLYLKFKPRTRAWINFLGCLVFLIPFCILIIYSSHKFIINSFLIKETSVDPGGLPARYILKACIPAGFFLVLLQGISYAVNSLREALGKEDSQQITGDTGA